MKHAVGALDLFEGTGAAEALSAVCKAKGLRIDNRKDTNAPVTKHKFGDPLPSSSATSLTEKGQDNIIEPKKGDGLIDRAHKLIMGWTERAACTSAVSMFFWNAGMYNKE